MSFMDWINKLLGVKKEEMPSETPAMEPTADEIPKMEETTEQPKEDTTQQMQ